MSDSIKNKIKETYTQALTQRCCGGESPEAHTVENGGTFASDYQHLGGYVADADYGLGCGLPTEVARLAPGQTVLDLGAGAGNDVFVARQVVGEAGRVIGVDMTEAMVARAEENRQKLGYPNVEFILGEIEALPLPEASVDVVVSNCVMNLVPDKAQAYAEVYRVLRPGGHFSISDIVVEGELPPAVREAAELYAGCVAGAVEKTAYLDLIRAAGFPDVAVVRQAPHHLPDELLLKYLSPDELAAFRQSGTGILSVTLNATR